MLLILRQLDQIVDVTMSSQFAILIAAIIVALLVKLDHAESEANALLPTKAALLSVSWWKIAGCAALVVIALAGLEQLYLRQKNGGIPGPRFTLPFGIGASVEMIRHPYQFWLKEHKLSLIHI